MKTVIFFGSARRRGHTKAIVDHLVEELEGEVTLIDAYREKNIKSCVDCRYCWNVKGCSINDDMQPYYDAVEEADNIVIASPVYFHSITGELKALIDRLQVYWTGYFRKDRPKELIRKGAYLLVGGAPLFEGQFTGAEIVCEGVLNDLSAHCNGRIEFPDSDAVDAKNHPDVIRQVKEIAAELNKKLVLPEGYEREDAPIIHREKKQK